ncbi:NADP-dependent 3-hydroxy acid dehydrogenase YdfG [Murinocardiopsis flavida]|uniref:NADP-dependent 3-hydroxy acid dehydrogenase YdfG n=1 Tax=Murinocardiopsis flavida TaxID=645275 RepID=A0A2P8D965_9ACTN|nr:SDR family oxidoreductase [Murinocardiopsis flavida]PSK93764.1 NADP-dependent 3-hydroxy acid dehydrogenase YdfG [Murinocardiopsis flavida]
MGVRGVAVVTGAGSGIGRAAAVALGAGGFAVVAAGRRGGPLAECVGAVEAAGGAAVAVPTDVADAGAVRSLFAAAVEWRGRVDVLFNNAGVMPGAAVVDEVSDAVWEEAVGVNLTGAFYCAREAFAVMRAQDPRGGRIINNGSVAAHAPRPGSIAYTATKHAVTGLTKSLSLDGRPFGIACGQIDIGNAATGLTEGLTAGPGAGAGGEPSFDVAHAGEAVRHMASLPLGANVQFMTLMATAMPYIGRG